MSKSPQTWRFWSLGLVVSLCLGSMIGVSACGESPTAPDPTSRSTTSVPTTSVPTTTSSTTSRPTTSRTTTSASTTSTIRSSNCSTWPMGPIGPGLTFNDAASLGPYCISPNSGNPAAYYTFSLLERLQINVFMKSTVVASYLALRRGAGLSGSIVEENGPRGGGAQLLALLDPGVYTIEATSGRPDEYGAFDLELNMGASITTAPTSSTTSRPTTSSTTSRPTTTTTSRPTTTTTTSRRTTSRTTSRRTTSRATTSVPSCTVEAVPNSLAVYTFIGNWVYDLQFRKSCREQATIKISFNVLANGALVDQDTNIYLAWSPAEYPTFWMCGLNGRKLQPCLAGILTSAYPPDEYRITIEVAFDYCYGFGCRVEAPPYPARGSFGRGEGGIVAESSAGR